MQGKTTQRLRAIFTALASGLMSKRLPLLLAILSILLALPSLWAGWVMDDHFHRLKMRGTDRLPGIFDTSWDMFRFLDGNAERTLHMMDVGTVPWWTYPEIVAQFWRPVTTLTHRLDYLLWPESPAMMHAQSLLWFGGLTLVVTCLYRRLMGVTVVAGLAALLYAIDDAHATPAGWIANRNALVAALFGILAVVVHDKWRRDKWRSGLILGPLLLAVALFAKEAAVAVAAYLFAYAMCLDRAPWRSRVLSLVPYAVVIAAWRIAWVLHGNGLHGVGLYVDPVSNPLRFLASLLARAPVLLLGQLALPPADVWIIFDEAVLRRAAVVATTLLAGLAFILAPTVRQDRISRFWAMGMLLSLIPACATFPSDRLLSYAGLGAMGLVARFLHHRQGESSPAESAGRLRPMATVSVVWLFVAVHMVIAPVSLAIRTMAPAGPHWIHDQLHVRTPMDASVENQDVVIVNAPSAFHAMYLPVLRELDGLPVPRRTRILAPGFSGMTVRRTDNTTLVVAPNEDYFAWAFHRLFRNEQHSFEVGDRVELTGLTIEITAIGTPGGLTEAAFHFAVPLEEPSLRWLQYKDGNFVSYVPPAVGQTHELPPMYGD